MPRAPRRLCRGPQCEQPVAGRSRYCGDHQYLDGLQDLKPWLYDLQPEWIGEPMIPVTIVCGPPGSGKTTYVLQQAGDDELIIDLDRIKLQNGIPPYIDDWQLVRIALRERNRLLDSLSKPNAYTAAWLIVTGRTRAERAWWQRKLNARLVMMPTPPPVCIQRVCADPRRPPRIQAAQVAVIQRFEY